MPALFRVSFPTPNANFSADIRTDADLRTMLKMVLTYQGDSYEKDPKSVIDGIVRGTDGKPLVGAHIHLRNGSVNQTAETDSRGHFRFDSVAPDNYRIAITSAGSCGRESQQWKLRIEPSQILLRSFRLNCRSDLIRTKSAFHRDTA